jgi:lipopolysaccharide export system permease protein
MKIRDRYITKTLLSYTSVVLLVWLSIYSFFNFLEELNSIGKADYTTLEAIKYILLQMPELAYKQASPVILLGCVLGMGYLATTNQLVVLRVSGNSILKLTAITIKIALTFVIVILAFGEFFVPLASEEGEKGRAKALGQSFTLQSREGFWIREGGNYINVINNIDSSSFTDVTIYQVSPSNKIETIITSESADFDGSTTLAMKNANIISLNEINNSIEITSKKRNNYNKIVSFDQDLIETIKKEPKELTTRKIYKHIQFLDDNKQASSIYKVELYKRLIKPVTLVAMILLAMLFIFGSNRDVSLGRKIFFGITLGLSFEMLSRVSGALSLSFNLSPLMSAVLPTLVIIVLAIVLLSRKSMG